MSEVDSDGMSRNMTTLADIHAEANDRFGAGRTGESELSVDRRGIVSMCGRE